MAIMIPDAPRQFHKESKEDIIFRALEKLSDEYYVFHSFSIVKVYSDNVLRESESDFLIFNRKKGILVIEAKAGEVSYKNGRFYYESGRRMNGEGPFAQARNNKWNLFHYIQEKEENGRITDHCKFLFGVWFMELPRKELNDMDFPTDIDKKLVLTMDDLEDPQKKIEEIFNIEINNEKTQTDLSIADTNWLINTVLCPHFNIVPQVQIKNDTVISKFKKLVSEQSAILNYLEEAKFAVINGVAGTGKTMLALEKARRHSLNKQKVLFLVFNSTLKNFLRKTYSKIDDFKYVTFTTLDELALNLTDESDIINRYKNLHDYLLVSICMNKKFEYNHIVIDEGHEFGIPEIEENKILELLKDLIFNSYEDGSFYIFYDKLYFKNGYATPEIIEDADTKLTLYKNLRNSLEISKTSLKIFNLEPHKFADGIKNIKPDFYSVREEDQISCINKCLDNCIKHNYDNVVILTVGKKENSRLNFVDDGYYLYKNRKYFFTEVRDFKGLEANDIILIDVTKDTFINHREDFYIGASRAKLGLDIITNITKEDNKEILDILDKESSLSKKSKKELAIFLKATFKQ